LQPVHHRQSFAERRIRAGARGGIQEPCLRQRFLLSLGCKHGNAEIGSGPLTDYEVDLLNYTDVKWPNYVPVVTAGPTTTYVFAGNIAQVPNSAGRVLELLGDRLFLQILYADENGAPGNNAGTDLTFPFGIVGAGYRSGNRTTLSPSTSPPRSTTIPRWDGARRPSTAPKWM